MDIQHDLILSLVFYLCGCAYALIGYYVLVVNAQSGINRLFLLLTSTMAVWSFSFAIANWAKTAEQSAFWRSFAVFGWGVFYSVVFHFVLILTKYKARKKKALLHSLIYLPAIINIILYAPFGIVGADQYQMVKTEFGWINIYPTNIWDGFFTAYYLVFSLASIVLLLRWYTKIKQDSLLRRHAQILISAIVISFIFGVVTENLPFFRTRFPPLTILVLLLPVSALYVALRKFGLFLERKSGNQVMLKEGALSSDSRTRLFQMGNFVFAIGALAAFALFFFGRDYSVRESLTYGGVILFCGALIGFAPELSHKEKTQNLIFMIAAAIVIVYLGLLTSNYGGMTSWVLFVFYLLFSIILGDRSHTVVFIIVAILMELRLWFFVPSTEIEISQNIYLERIAVMLLIYYIIRYLSGEYHSRLRGYERFAKEQRLLERISNSFVSANKENVGQKVDEMLAMSAEILAFNHAYLCELEENYDALILNTCLRDEKEGSFPYRPRMELPRSFFPVMDELMSKKEPVICEDITSVSLETHREQRNYFAERGVNAFAAVPILADQVITGMLVVEYYERNDLRTNANRQYVLQIIANMLGDIKKKIDYENRVHRYAFYDTKTALANRNLLNYELERLTEGEAGSTRIALLNVELINFRTINNTYGHNVGDQIIVKVAEILEELVEDKDMIARSGTSQFILVIPNLRDREHALTYANEIMEAFSRPVATHQDIEALFIDISIGIALYPEDGRKVDLLLRNVDLAGYNARFGNNRITFFSEQMQEYISDNTTLTNRLFDALKRKEFFLEFQPQVNFAIEQVAGAEALLRWAPTANERISPGQFIPILEQTGLIHDVGLWVLEKTLETHLDFIKKGFPPLRFSINISIIQLQRDGFVDSVAKLLQDYGVDPQYFELEVTESAFSVDPLRTVTTLRQLKELGVKIAIDDFGKGYSSLQRLYLLPIDRIKIDKSFVDDIEHDDRKANMLGMIILFSRLLKAQVTVEGVETKQQIDLLKNYNCDEIQGFYYSRPLAPPLLEEFLTK